MILYLHEQAIKHNTHVLVQCILTLAGVQKPLPIAPLSPSSAPLRLRYNRWEYYGRSSLVDEPSRHTRSLFPATPTPKLQHGDYTGHTIVQRTIEGMQQKISETIHRWSFLTATSRITRIPYHCHAQSGVQLRRPSAYRPRLRASRL